MSYLTNPSMTPSKNLKNTKSNKTIKLLKNKLADSLMAWSIPIVFVILWFYLTDGKISTRLFPTPFELVHTTIRLIQDGTLLVNLQISSIRASLGLLVGGSIGFILGITTGQFKLAEKILNTPIQMIRNVPHLAMLPVVLIWFGIGESSKLVLISLGTFFPIYLNTFHGIRSVDKSLIEMGKIYGFSAFEMFKNIILPGATSSIMIGVRQSLGRMWLTLIVAETIAAKSGIGYMATNARELMMMDVIVLSLIIYALLGSISDFIAVAIEKYLLRWNPNYQEE